jgi:hypothetical protein
MTDKQLRDVFQQPVQFYKEESNLSKLRDRWVSLIRQNASILVKYSDGDKLPSPDLFDIANEIESFFTGLEFKK